MKSKKLLSLLLIFTLIISLFAACSGGGSNDAGKDEPAPATEGEDTGTEAETPPADKPAASGEKVEISFWYGWGGTEGEAMKKLIQKFNDSQDRIVVIGTEEGDYSKQTTAIAAGNPPDVASNFGHATVPNGVTGQNTPLDAYMEKSGLDASAFVPGAIKQQQYDGVTYAVPLNMHISMLLYNKKILAEAGYDRPPETIQEMEEYFDKLSQIEPTGEIKRLAFYPNLDIYSYAYVFGGGFYNESTGEITPQDPGLIEAMKWNAKMWKKAGGSEKINPFTASLGGWLTAEDPFFVGKYAMTSGGEWVPTFQKKFAPDLDMGIAPMPYDAKHPEKKGAGTVNTSTLYIPKGAKHPDEAWEFINWFMQPENVAEWNAAIGNLPPVLAALDVPVFDNVPGFKEFLEESKNPNLVTFPASPYMADYMNEIGVAYNEVLLGNMTAEQAAKQIADKMVPILEKHKK
ncbi:ABC transporter substrate-binding protein [Paenibacillus thermotolerans]|uniref:ABC transporter substrate-binding protein n=1 Tax=Paenibacillus thermotolerans TaxID=3027807 RepID=UPI0023675FD4|nr:MULTISPECIES: ABC transporter substrate-binding protein [unclassified Paenibacillus]